LDSFILAFKSLGPGRIMALMLGIGATLWLTSEATKNLTQPGMGLLYGGLSSEEVAGISNLLDTSQTPYEIRGDSAVYVPADQIGQLRLQTAGQGLVGSSVTGYEVFDGGSNFGTTSFVQNINARRALEGELSRTIASMPSVQAARVHLVTPQRSAFSRQNKVPSAAVALNLASRTLNASQIQSIASLVAASAPELTTENITIIDQRGTLLFDGKSQAAGGPGNADKTRRSIEQSYEEKITAMLARITGPGKVSVRVNADVNLDQLDERSELYDPTRQVIRSEQRSEVTANSQENDGGGAAGVDGNIPGGGGGGGSEQQNETRTDETINYEISRTVRNLKRQGGEIEKLSIAVLVEGRYEGENGDSYIPYNDEELANMARLVRTAAGYDEERGDTLDIIDMRFTPLPEIEGTEPPLFNKGDIISLSQYALLIVGMLSILLFLVKPALTVLANTTGQTVEVRLKQELSKAGVADTLAAAVETAQAESAATVDIEKVEGQVKESTVKKVNELVTNHPEETINVVRDWMADGETSSQ